MALPAASAVNVTFPGGVAAVTLTGSLLGFSLNTANLPLAELTVQVAADQATPADYRPVMVGGKPLVLPIGRGGYFGIPPEVQQLPAKIQLTLTNFGAATASVELYQSA